jgi:serine/threonine-protein kinase
VTDFGIARSLESDGLTATGRVLGTTDYVSPEQAMGREVDARSDIYSLGVLLWEMLVGEPPFKAETLVGVAMKHVNDKIPDVQRRRREVSSALAAVIERATEKDPKKRYPEMDAMLADLEGALEVEVARAGSSHGEATTVLDSVPERRLLTPRRASIAGILLVLAGTAAALVIAGVTGEDGRGGGGGGGDGVGQEVPLEAASAFDPPPGDGIEHDDEVRLAIDGNPTSVWLTETYTAAAEVEAAANKPGVGLIVDAGRPVEATEISIGSTRGGWDVEIYAAVSDPPDDLEGWGQPVGGLNGADAEQTVDLSVPAPARYYLIWFTTLSEYDDGFRVEVQGVRLTAA